MAQPSNSPVIYMSKEDILSSPLYQYLTRPVFKSIFKMSDDDFLSLILDLESWEAPKHVQGVFSYSFSGYDSLNRPIWVIKFGEYSLKDILAKGEEEILERYFWQTILWVAKSILEKTPEENPSQQAVFIVDAMEMTKTVQFLHGPTLGFLFRMVRKYIHGALYILGLGLGINVSKVGFIIINLLRPIAGEALKRIEVYGHDESKWRSRLSAIFKQENTPNFDGTDRGFYRIILSA